MIARGGLSIVVIPAVLCIIFLAIALAFSSIVAMLLTIPAGIIFTFFLVFFRDPPRRIGKGIVSPADGKVIGVDHARHRLVIYMGLKDVHVNRAPWSGCVKRLERRGGGHSRAMTDAASGNASLRWEIGTLIGTITLRQVTGLFARRIVPYVGEGASVKKGQRIGIIRFGSRVEVTLPPSINITVQVGERVRAGETKIAEVAHAA